VATNKKANPASGNGATVGYEYLEVLLALPGLRQLFGEALQRFGTPNAALIISRAVWDVWIYSSVRPRAEKPPFGERPANS
jgi:hypothetical protein